MNFKSYNLFNMINLTLTQLIASDKIKVQDHISGHDN